MEGGSRGVMSIIIFRFLRYLIRADLALRQGLSFERRRQIDGDCGAPLV